jgi:hypothetical protein
MVSIVGSVVEWLKVQWAGIDWAAIWGAVKDFAGGLEKWIGTLAGAVADWLGGVWASIHWADIWQQITDFATGLVEQIEGALPEVQAALEDVWQRIDWRSVWGSSADFAQAFTEFVESIDVRPIGEWVGARLADFLVGALALTLRTLIDTGQGIRPADILRMFQLAGTPSLLMRIGTDWVNSIVTGFFRELARLAPQIGAAIRNVLTGQPITPLAAAASRVGGAGGHNIPRQAGGPVWPGESFLVGERGPEVFVPSRSGAVVPSGSVVVHMPITIQGNADQSTVERFRQVVRDELTSLVSGNRRGQPRLELGHTRI